MIEYLMFKNIECIILYHSDKLYLVLKFFRQLIIRYWIINSHLFLNLFLTEVIITATDNDIDDRHRDQNNFN